MVEAAGVEPAPPQSANWLMARDFRRNSLEIRCLPGNSLCSGVLSSALECSPVWRHIGDGRLRMASILDKASPYDVHLTVFL